MERAQFTFYRSYRDALRALPPKEFKAAVLAICDYALDETEPALSGTPNSVFILIRPTLDSGRIKAANRAKKTKTNAEQTQNEKKTKSKQTRKEKEGEKERETERERTRKRTIVLSLYLSHRERLPRLTRLPNMPSCAEGLLTPNRSTTFTPSPIGGTLRASRSTTGNRNSSFGKSANWRSQRNRNGAVRPRPAITPG